MVAQDYQVLSETAFAVGDLLEDLGVGQTEDFFGQGFLNLHNELV